MASARSLHTFNRGKQVNCSLHAGLSVCRKPQKCRLDQYAVQKLSQQENRQKSKPKTTKQKQQKHTTKTKTILLSFSPWILSHLPVSPFFHVSPLSLRPGVVGVCFEVPGCNVMPVRLLFVISGILAGGIPGFRMELCCFSHPPTWPIGVFCGCSVLLLVLGHSLNDT